MIPAPPLPADRIPESTREDATDRLYSALTPVLERLERKAAESLVVDGHDLSYSESAREESAIRALRLTMEARGIPAQRIEEKIEGYRESVRNGSRFTVAEFAERDTKAYQEWDAQPEAVKDYLTTYLWPTSERERRRS